MQRNPTSPSRSSFADREPDAGEDRLGAPERLDADADDDEPQVGVARRVNLLPLREEEGEGEGEEEELSETDIMEEHDMQELDADDLAKMEGPDA